MWCCRRIEKVSSTDSVKNEEVIRRVKEERNIRHTIKRRKVNWIGHVLRRNCLVKHVIEGKVEERIAMMRRRRKWSKQLLDGLKEKSGYWKLKEEAPRRSLWRKPFGRTYKHFAREIKQWMYINISFLSTDLDSYVQNKKKSLNNRFLKPKSEFLL
jgi:hypothetical protein